MSVADRFWAKVDKTESCWLWQGSKPNGYGQFHIGGKLIGAHRVAYEMLRGPIPDGLVLDHLCQTPACVNPDHLEPVTHQENIRRGPRERYGANRYKTRCSRGHELSGDNVEDQGGGRRRCVTCRRARDRNRARVTELRAINAALYEALERINDTGDVALDIDWIRRISRRALAQARGDLVNPSEQVKP